MHVLHHCIESIQYEPVITSITTIKPVITTAAVHLQPTTFHKPGYFGPERPPPTPPSSISICSIPSTNHQEQATTPSTETAETLLWNDKLFFEWFLQNKYKQINLRNEYNLQFLDQLPLSLLQDIDMERYELPALLDKDNVKEFRRIYDDKFRQSKTNVPHVTGSNGVMNRLDNSATVASGVGGRKRVPPTKPYIHMLMLYDLLKREAKKYMYQLYEGYSQEILGKISQIKAENGQQQLLFVLFSMLEEKNIYKADVTSRTKAMITELQNPNSAITKALTYVPPLIFAP
ncbi:uncharacterized protein LOC131683273 [Topomyia yanbarensis]|uniref:uncharacterized protein LOC131683273 n=1 Tax=Topomyia yanbarensis TaxID=2498891 RepID=UPI00273C2A68|nr:uncharacterized protein LOC131683273 [Topomyia yanbarensis]